MPRILAFAFCLLALCGSAAAARAEARRALIIANKNYAADIGPLANPHKDAAILEKALKAHGFEVTVVKDASRVAILAAVDRHLDALAADMAAEGEAEEEGERGGAVSLIYYTGHGLARDAARNYLIPVSVQDPASETLWYESVELNSIRDSLTGKAPQAAHILLFDACRNELKIRERKSLGGGDKGFAPIRAEEWGGTLVAFSTDAEDTASDGSPDDAAGPYALALAEELEAADGQEIAALLNNVRFKVRERAKLQTPWYNYQLNRPVTFTRSGVAPPAEESAADVSGQCSAEVEQKLFSMAQNDRTLVSLFLQVCPESVLAPLLVSQEGAPETAAAEPAPQEGGRVADPSEAQTLQALLAAAGYYEGAADGAWGPVSQRALERFAEERGGLDRVAPGAAALARLQSFVETLRAEPQEVAAAGATVSEWKASLPAKYRDLFSEPGDLAPGSGQGVTDATIYAKGIRFPLETAPAYLNSQVFGVGGVRALLAGGQCDESNYSYPWRDTFCETRGYKTDLCPAGKGLQGVKIRPASCEKDKHWVVAVEQGRVSNIGSYTVTLLGDSGREYRYLHMNMRRLAVKKGDRVLRGQRLGLVSTDFGGTPTTLHLHFEIRQVVREPGGTIVKRFVPPYTSLVDAYIRLLEGAESDLVPADGAEDASGPN